MAHPQKGGVPGDSGVVDQHLDRPDLGLHPLAAFLAGVEIPDVPLVDLHPRLLGEGLRSLVVAGVIGDDGAALALKFDRYGPADTSRAAGHQRNSRHRSSLSVRRRRLSFSRPDPA